MAGRFSNLEFRQERQESQSPGELQASWQKNAERDTTHLLQQARVAHGWREHEAALRLYTRCLQEDRRVIAAWVGQMRMLVQLGEYREARVWSDKALELFRGHGELLAAKAQACVRLNDRRGGFECSDAAMQATGSSPWRWAARGELLLATGGRQYDECFQRALAEPAADWFDRVQIARIYSFYRRSTSALHYLNLALAAEPTQGCLWFDRGECQRELGLRADAAQSYQHCLSLRPDYAPARHALDELDKPDSLLGRLKGFWKRRRGR